MARISRTVAAIAMVVAIMLAGVAAFQYAARTLWQSLQVQAFNNASIRPASSNADVEGMRSALLTQTELPPGTQFQVMAITPASFEASTNGMVVRPESCLAALKAALGGARVDGWQQVGMRPTVDGNRPYANAVGRVNNSSLSVDRLRASIGTCTSGTVSWPALNITATISLSEVAAPAVSGASTFVYKSTMTYNGVTANQLAAAASCPIEPSPSVSAGSSSATATATATGNPTASRTASPTASATGNPNAAVVNAAYNCITYTNVSSQNTPMNITTSQYVGYAVSAGIYVESCAAEMTSVTAMLSVPFQRLQQAGYV